MCCVRLEIDETSPSDSVRLAFCEFDGDASTAVYTGNQRLLYIYILIRMGGGVEIWKYGVEIWNYSIGVVPFSRMVLVPSDPIEASNKDKVIHKSFVAIYNYNRQWRQRQGDVYK